MNLPSFYDGAWSIFATDVDHLVCMIKRCFVHIQGILALVLLTDRPRYAIDSSTPTACLHRRISESPCFFGWPIFYYSTVIRSGDLLRFKSPQSSGETQVLGACFDAWGY